MLVHFSRQMGRHEFAQGVGHLCQMLVDGLLRIQFHAIQIHRQLDRSGPHLTVEQVAEIMRRIGGDEQHAPPLLCHGERRGGGHGRLADTALATEEQNAFAAGDL